MESTSRIYTSPSFNRISSNDISDIADRVVQELRIQNGFRDDDVFSFSDDDNPPEIGGDGEVNTDNHPEEEEEHEFEFPVVRRDANSSPVSTDEVISDDHILLRYPVFDRSLLSEVDLNNNNGIDLSEIDSTTVPRTRPSLRKLLSEERDSPSTSSSSEADDLDGITPGTYCVWKPKTEPRGKHKKSNSISIGNTTKRWKVRDLLKRSYSDDNYSTGKESPVVLFLPPIPPKQKTNDEKVNKIEKTGKIASGIGGGVAATKTEKNIPAHKVKIGNIRIPPHLPYRQDQVAAFANFTGSTNNLYRY